MFAPSRLQPKAEGVVFIERKAKDLGTSILGGAERQRGQTELRTAGPGPPLLV